MTTEKSSSSGESTGSGASAINPFPVYPVSSLREIAATILDRTVSTEAVISIDQAISRYSDPERSPPAGLAMRIRGDYGTGKTHLVLYAQASLRRRWPNGESRVTALLASATETTFSSWYLTVVGPLVAQLDLEAIFVRVLARAALDVADQVFLTLDQAALIRTDPLNVYPALRDGLISWTDVERAMVDRVDSFTQRGSDELRSVLSALPWPERRSAAIRWISGKDLNPGELEQLGVTRNLDPEAEAEAVLVALAGAAALGGGSFALIVDEFEHLMADDRRTGTLRNATAIKRLLEGLTAMGALVLIAGHWKAWEDLMPDVKARFTGQATVDLIALTGEEVSKLVATSAPDWFPRLNEATADVIVEVGGRNIRRVLSILHQLYSETKDGFDPIGPVAVRAAAETLQGLATTTAKAADVTVEETVRASGGQVTRNETLFGRLSFDLIARRGPEIRLVVDIRYAATSAELSQLLEDFSIAVNAVQRRQTAARGLLIVSGAVDQSTLGLLQSLPGIDALAGEGPQAEEAIQALVHRALSLEALPAPASSASDMQQLDVSEAAEVEARERIRKVRRDRVDEAERTSIRLQGIDFGGGEREVAAARVARGVVPNTPASALGADRHVLDSFSESMAQQKPSLLSFMLSQGNTLLVAGCFTSLTILFAFLAAGDRLAVILGMGPESEPGPFLMTIAYCAFGLFSLVFILAKRLHSESRAYVQFHRLGRQFLEELIILGFPHNELLKVKNRLIDESEGAGGFKDAILNSQSFLKESLERAEMLTAQKTKESE